MAGQDYLKATFNLCKDVNKDSDVTSLKSWLAGAWGNVAMVEYPYPANFIQNLPAWPIKVCYCVVLWLPDCWVMSLYQNISTRSRWLDSHSRKRQTVIHFSVFRISLLGTDEFLMSFIFGDELLSGVVFSRASVITFSSPTGRMVRYTWDRWLRLHRPTLTTRVASLAAALTLQQSQTT